MNAKRNGRILAGAAALLGLLVSTMSVGCSSSSKKPGWVADPYDGYPQSEFLAASGEGASMAEAERDATSIVARQVARELDQQTVDLESYERRVSRAGFDPARTVELLELAAFDESRRMLGFDIVDRHTHRSDDEADRYFARGVLDRDELARAYETEMRRNAAFGNRMIARADAEPITMRKFAALRAAQATAEVFRDLRFIRDEIGLSGYSGDDSLDPPGKTVDELNAEIAALRAQVAASIEVVDGASVPDALRAEIASSLQRVGVPVRSDRGQGHVRILVDWDAESINESRDDLKLVNYRLSVEVVEDVSGYALASKYWDAKEGGLDERDAQANAIRIARREMAREMDEFIREALFEQSINDG